MVTITNKMVMLPLFIVLVHFVMTNSSPAPAPGPVPSNPVPGFPVPGPSPGPVLPKIKIHKTIRAAYWASFDDLPAREIETSYFTHIYYAFLLPGPTTYKLNVTSFDQEKMPELITAIRSKKPSVKILLSVGGAGNDPNVFSNMSNTWQTRAIFINSTIEVARNYGFDGLDLDWEWPSNYQDMFNLGKLFRQWRKAFDHEARITNRPRLLLTAAVYYSQRFLNNGEYRAYLVNPINQHLDFINPMCYDYHGSWENLTGPHSALFDYNGNLSTNYGIKSWLQAGVLPEKLVQGLALYGRSWKLQNPSNNGIGALAAGPGLGDQGVVPFHDIVQFNDAKDVTLNYDGTVVTYYSYNETYWIGYDDVMSIGTKVQFAKDLGLGGYFFWVLGNDKNWTLTKAALNAWESS